MTHVGVGVLIRRLGSNEESVAAFSAAIGKTIAKLWHDDSALHFVFSDGTRLKLADEGQSCCEDRYMTTDDDLDYFLGAKFVDAEVKDVREEEADYGYHDVQFLEVQTDRGVFTMANHNEHNGYYGGFSIEASVDEDDGEE